MLNEGSKKKLRRLWYKRLGVSIGLVIALGFSFTKGLSIAQVLLELIDAKQLQVKAERVHAQALVRAAWAKQSQVEQEQIQARLERYRAERALAKVMNIQARKNKKLQSNVIYLAVSVVSLIIISILLLNIQNYTYLSFTGQLICFLPEEYVAELEALSQHLKSNNYPTWIINTIILKCFLELIFALYVRIRIDNFRQPIKK